MEAQPLKTLNTCAQRKVWKDSLLGAVLGPSLLPWVPPSSPNTRIRASTIALAPLLRVFPYESVPNTISLLLDAQTAQSLSAGHQGPPGTHLLPGPSSSAPSVILSPREAPSQWGSLPTTPFWALARSGHAPSLSGQGERGRVFRELALRPRPGTRPFTPTPAPPKSPDV